MECLLQYWDELDDLYWSIIALRERARRIVVLLLGTLVAIAVAAVSAVVAFRQPDLSLLVAALLSVSLLVRPDRLRAGGPGVSRQG